MGALLGDKICEVVGCLLLYNLNNIIDPGNYGLYRDDGLNIVDKYTPRKGDIIRKKLHWLFDKFWFKLDIQTNPKITDYLDITFNLYKSTVSPFRKNNQYPCYINVGSNHPRQIFKYIPNGIMFRLYTNFFNINIFTQNKAQLWANVKNNGYKAKLVHKITDETSDVRNRRKNRTRKILWFTLQYNMAVAYKLGKEFFILLKKNFPRSSNLCRIFYRNTVKLSYSCMPNVANLINENNTKNPGINNVLSSLNAIALRKPLVPSKANVNMNA